MAARQVRRQEGYGVAYKILAQKIQTDANFLQRVESRRPLWEEDVMEWKHRTEETEEWTTEFVRVDQR